MWKPAVALAAAALVSACATTGQSQRGAAAVVVKGCDADSGCSPVSPNKRQYYDAGAGRYYYYDSSTRQYYWEDGRPRG